jgi:(S)-ureidoglycine aminohydrolase
MNDPLFGHTRTYVGPRHALITPDGHVASALPGVSGVRAVYHISPAMGAKFSQATLTFEAGGKFAWEPLYSIQKFVYVSAGRLQMADGKVLGPGGYAYGAGQEALELTALEPATATIFERRYLPDFFNPGPNLLTGDAAEIEGKPFLGNAKALLQVLLPDSLEFDIAVNIFTYQPGATLPFVETHVMEHGLLMLSGQGIYRLEDRWYPVKAGDVIWMAPYCPQWFVAMGDEPAAYLYYKDVNRHPLLAP